MAFVSNPQAQPPAFRGLCLTGSTNVAVDPRLVESLRPVPPGDSKSNDTRYLDIREGGQLDEVQMARLGEAGGRDARFFGPRSKHRVRMWHIATYCAAARSRSLTV
jgi:hypothetical protein